MVKLQFRFKENGMRQQVPCKTATVFGNLAPGRSTCSIGVFISLPCEMHRLASLQAGMRL